MNESDTELLARYNHVKKEHDKVVKSMEKMKLGSPARTKKAQWGGCLCFTLLQIISEIEERGLTI